MRVLWRSLLVLGALALIACEGDLPADDPNDPPPGDDPYAPCTDPFKCCADEDRVCEGDPDGQIICTCRGLWDCSKNPDKCEQEMPTPDGGTGWDCTWSEFKYTCEKQGSKDNPPDGGTDWNCSWNESEFKWVCTTEPPNPTNEPDGTAVWKCTVDNENNTLKCEREGSDEPPPGGGDWECTPDGVCTKKDDNGGLPPGGNDWKCHQVVKDGKTVWVCYGTVPEGSAPPGGNDWQCKKVKTEFGQDIYRCERPEGPGDYPPGGGWYSCVKGSEFGGTQCTKVDEPPEAPGPEPQPGATCSVNERMWCDGLVYCGWGQVECDPATGTWKTKMINGTEMLDCQESLAGGKVPNTVCACYHYFFNPSCCERPDCIVPPGSSGQICPKSPGKLCDYCNPQKPECTEPGAKCIVTNQHETFCGRDCSSQPCPAGYTCMSVKLKIGQTKQCVPADFSCYY